MIQRKIHKFARIIHVADVYDALTSKRAYKDSMNPADAIEYIMANVKLDSGTVVDLMNKLDITILQILNT